MIAKARKYLSSDLLRVSSLNALSTLIRMITGLISVKFVATLIGPAGIAILGQLNNFTTITQTIASAGINQGVTKYVAENKNTPGKSLAYIATAFWITIVASLITGIVIYVSATPLANHFLKDPQLAIVFRIYAATLWFFAINALILSIVNGQKDFKNLFLINVAGSVIGLLFTVALTHYFSLKGTLIAAVTFQSIVLVFTVFMIRRQQWSNPVHFRPAAYEKRKAVDLWKFSAMSLLSAFLVPISQLIIRNHIITEGSINDAGLWEGVNRISNIYLLVAITSLSAYFLPRLAELHTNVELKAELKSVYTLMIPGLALCAAAIFVLRDFIISLLFSKAFYGMADIIHFQLIGDMVKMAGWVLGYLMLAKVMLRQYIFLEILSFLAQVGLAMVFVRQFGVVGATMSYALGHFIYLIVAAFLLRSILFHKPA